MYNCTHSSSAKPGEKKVGAVSQRFGLSPLCLCFFCWFCCFFLSLHCVVSLSTLTLMPVTPAPLWTQTLISIRLNPTLDGIGRRSDVEWNPAASTFRSSSYLVIPHLGFDEWWPVWGNGRSAPEVLFPPLALGAAGQDAESLQVPPCWAPSPSLSPGLLSLLPSCWTEFICHSFCW